MSSDEAIAARTKVQTAIAADRLALISQADGFVVVSWWQEKSSDPRRGHYHYDRHDTLNDALDEYRQYEDGEYSRARAIGIFPVKAGMPCGSFDPAYLLRLMAETRRDVA